MLRPVRATPCCLLLLLSVTVQFRRLNWSSVNYLARYAMLCRCSLGKSKQPVISERSPPEQMEDKNHGNLANPTQICMGND